MAQKKKQEPTGPVYKGVYRNRGLFKARIYGWQSDVYLGHFFSAEKAAQAYDLACIKLRGVFGAQNRLNFSMENYAKGGEVEKIMAMDFPEFLAYIRGTADALHSRIPGKQHGHGA